MSDSNRRAFVKGCLAAAASPVLLGSAQAEPAPKAQKGIRDRLWIFCCAANSDFPAIRRRSVMTPAEGAFFLGNTTMDLGFESVEWTRRWIEEVCAKD